MDNEKQKEIDELCERIQNLVTAHHLSDEEKLTFARKALEIIESNKKENAVQ